MANNTNSPAPTTPERELHLVCSSGGSRAILASAGVLLACEQAGVKRFKSIGGVSGGSIPTALYASGLSAKECVSQAMEIDFASLLTRRASFFKILLAYFMQSRNEKVRPVNGVLTSEKLADFMEGFHEGWPEGYWTMGIADKSQILFGEEGVFEIGPDGKLRVLSCDPGPLGVAVRGSCAVPGIISAVEFKNRFLFDGALGPEGRAPVTVPSRLYSAKPKDIIVCDVGDDTGNTSQRVTKLWKFICGPECVPEIEEPDFSKDNTGLIVVTPKITGFRSLQFTLTRDQKWQAVMAGFVDAVPELTAAGILTGEKLIEAEEIVRQYSEILAGAEGSADGELSRLNEELLLKNDLL